MVACKDNDKVGECSSVVVGGCNSVVGRFGICVWIGEGSWELRELPRELYPNRNRSLYDTILTDKHSLIIHKTAYLILIILIIYQDKKIG